MPIIMKPTSVIIAKLGINPNGKVQKFFTSECARKMDKYVPMDKGFLREYKIVDNYIIYGDGPSNPYAKVQYRGMREDGSHVIRNYTTEGTGSYWDRRMVSADLPLIVKEIQKKLGGR